MPIDTGPVWEDTRGMNKRVATIKVNTVQHGDVLADGFVIDSVYQPLGNPSAYFAMGRVYPTSPRLFKRFLGYTGQQHLNILLP